MPVTTLLLLPLIAGVICLRIRSRTWLEKVNLTTFAATLVCAIVLALRVVNRGAVSAWDGFFYADALSALVAALTALVAFVSTIYAVGYFRQDERSGKTTAVQTRRYYRLTPFFVFAMMLVSLANNIGVMWVAIEGTTLASVLLIAFYNERSSLEAAWKYIIIGSVGISLALFGTILTYYAAVNALGEDTGKGLNWSLLASLADRFNPAAMRLAFVMALIGYGTKAGLAPMHTWKPDAYAEAPVPASAVLGAGLINCALYAIIRFYVLSARCLGHDFPGRFLLWFGLASMAVATPFILAQRNFRRLLAYSSIEHAGIMVSALGFGGVLGFRGATLHLLFHALTKPLLFFTCGDIQQHFGTAFLRKVRGAIHVAPLSAALLLVATLAVTGTPPFSIFQSEFTILSGALASGHGWLALFFVLCIVTIFAGFLRHASGMTLGEAPQGISKADICPWKASASIIVVALIGVVAIWLPRPVFELVQQTAAIIQGAP